MQIMMTKAEHTNEPRTHTLEVVVVAIVVHTVHLMQSKTIYHALYCHLFRGCLGAMAWAAYSLVA